MRTLRQRLEQLEAAAAAVAESDALPVIIITLSGCPETPPAEVTEAAIAAAEARGAGAAVVFWPPIPNGVTDHGH